jgi:lipopolysaccharide export system protein LptA
MRNRVERLRIWLLGSAVFLLLVIAAFIGSARYLKRHFLADLPARLGVDIKSDANGVTWSRAVGGRTEYFVHAARKEEHVNGKLTLHDVGIILYGKRGNRRDCIQGDEFEYDPKAGVLRAMGLVHIDFQAAEAAAQAGEAQVGAGVVAPSACELAARGGVGSGAVNGASGAASDAKVLHVTTSGLVYLEKLGVAATSEYIEFQAGGMTGHATGADYSSDSGMLMLHSAVNMTGVAGGRPAELTASTAEFDGRNQEAFLTHVKYGSMGQSVEAEQATLHRRPDGTIARVEAQGNVTAKGNGATVVSQRGDVALNAASQPQTAVLTGGVRYSLDRSLRQVKGQADAATINFDRQAKPQPQHAVFTGAVHLTERTRASEAAREPWSTRDLTAAKVEAELTPGLTQSQLRDVEATGSPRLTVVNNGSLASHGGEGTTELAADDLKAHMIATADAKAQPQLDTIAGRGHTVLRQMNMEGIEQTSVGDTLDAKFRPNTALARTRPVAGKAAAGGQGAIMTGFLNAQVLWSAVQQGHVTMTRRAPARSPTNVGSGEKAPDDVERAMAERAVYDGDQDRMTLTGGVELTDADSELWANQVALDHKTGDSHAVGGVKVDYVQAKRNPTHDGGTVVNGAPGEPMHILADRADMERATDIATFHGKPARMWQGGDQVQAPVIEFSRPQQRMIARGEAGTGWSAAAQAAQVHTVLVRAGNDPSGTGGARAAKAGSATAGCVDAVAGKVGTSAAGGQSTNVVRIASGGMIYSGIQRQADFTGGFHADTLDGTVRANGAVVYLDRAAGANQAAGDGVAAMPSLAGDLDRVVASGRVELDKPGLHATGERLLYTASDRVFLLTGDSKTPPKAVGAQGTTTGAALRFQNSCDGSGGGRVEALSSVPGVDGQPVRTEVRINTDARKEKGKK